MSKFTDKRDKLEARLQEERDEYAVKGTWQWVKDNVTLVAIGVALLGCVFAAGVWALL